MTAQLRFWFYRLLLFLGLLAFARPVVLAHGGGQPQLTNEPVGPYLVSAWTHPEPPQVGEIHITLALALADSGEAVTEPAIRVTASTSGKDRISTPATHEGALTPYFYEADLTIPSAGSWRIEIAVDGDAGGGTAAFDLEVRETNTNWLLWGLAGIAVAAIAWVLWLLFRGERPETNPSGDERAT